MGAADIVGFAICWVFAAAVLTWGVLSERRRGGPSDRRLRRRRTDDHRSLAPVPRRRRTDRRGWRARKRPVVVISHAPQEARAPARPADSDWIVIESLPGSGPEVRAEGELLVTAALAARGLEPSDLGPGDRRVEVTYPADGEEVTLFLLRAGVLTPAEPS